MRITVTGGAGYIGSVLVPHLLARGHHVRVLDNFSLPGTQTSLLACCSHPRFEVVRGDVRDEQAVREAIRDADAIVPLAALVGAPACAADPFNAISVNEGAVRMLALKLRSKDQRLVFPNSNSAYGRTPPGEYATEDSPVQPLSVYARTKLEAERSVLLSGNAVVFRLATVFGVSPRLRCDLLVQDFCLRAVTDGFVVLYEAGARRNFVAVQDVARAFTYAIEGSLPEGVYNLGLDAANMTKRELAETIRARVPRFEIVEAPVGQDIDQRDYNVSSAKLAAAGFTASYSLERGITDLLAAFQMVRRTEYSNIR